MLMLLQHGHNSFLVTDKFRPPQSLLQ